MTAEQNLEKARAAYAAFSAGDAARAMADMSDEIEWTTAGNSTISGTIHGKQAVGELWAKFGEKQFTTAPEHWFADDERVVVLTHVSIGGEEADQADVLVFRDGKVVKFQSAGDTAMLERVYGSK